MRAVLAVVALSGGSVAACSGSSSDADGGADAAPEATLDAATEADADAAACLVGEGPADLPVLESAVFVDKPPSSGDAGSGDGGASDADAGDAGGADAGPSDGGSDAGAPPPAPAPIGGDESGMWAYRKVTLYLPASVGSFLDPSQVAISGSGWLELKGGKFRQSADLKFILAAGPLGTQTQDLKARVKGTYVKFNSVNLLLTPECAEGSPNTEQTFQYSRRGDELEVVSAQSFNGISVRLVILMTKR